MDRIEFRRLRVENYTMLGGDREVVDISINDRPLSDLLATRGIGGLPVPVDMAVVPGHRLWPGEAPHDVELSEAGRVAVLLCVDGLTGCGGATVEIRFGPRRVVWDEFHEVPLGRRIDVGPYTFD
jgi:hypothetical protein